MAIWFGISAKKVGKNVIGWVIGGALLSFVINTIFANLGILLVTTGSLEGQIEFDTYIAIRIISGIISVILMIMIGKTIFSRPS